MELDARLDERFFSDRGIASEVLLRLDIIWSYESFYISQNIGALRAAKYLEDKLKLLDYLGGVDLPATCFALYLHYTNEEVGSSEFYFYQALNWLRRAAQGEAYEDLTQGDIAQGSVFGSMTLNAKRKAQEQLRHLGA